MKKKISFPGPFIYCCDLTFMSKVHFLHQPKHIIKIVFKMMPVGQYVNK